MISVINSNRCLSRTIAIAAICLLTVTANGQTKISSPIKVDEFWLINTDDEMARLDRFAEELRSHPESSGVIVGYGSKSYPHGTYLRSIFGYRDYLVNSRGVVGTRVRVLDAGARRNSMTELWLIPAGLEFDVEKADDEMGLKVPTRFDSLQAGKGCWPEFTVQRYQPAEALEFYALALKSHSDWNGVIVVHPSRRSLREARKFLTDTRSQLGEKYDIPPKRIFTDLAGSRECFEITLWLTPKDLSLPTTSVEQFLYSQLMSEAEGRRFTVRRVEFVGNTWIRDDTLRRRIPGLQEGEIFRRDILIKSLASLSRLGSIFPVRLQDVDVRLDEDRQAIDMTIIVRPRSRKRR